MSFLTLPLAYLGWHYTIALRDFWRIARDLLAFLARFFSLKILLKTFFAPWRRLDEAYKKGFNLGDWLETLIVSILMRLVGILCRFWLVLAGLLALGLGVILAAIVFLVWLILPLVAAGLFISSLKFLFS